MASKKTVIIFYIFYNLLILLYVFTDKNPMILYVLMFEGLQNVDSK